MSSNGTSVTEFFRRVSKILEGHDFEGNVEAALSIQDNDSNLKRQYIVTRSSNNAATPHPVSVPFSYWNFFLCQLMVLAAFFIVFLAFCYVFVKLSSRKLAGLKENTAQFINDCKGELIRLYKKSGIHDLVGNLNRDMTDQYDRIRDKTLDRDRSTSSDPSMNFSNHTLRSHYIGESSSHSRDQNV